MVLPCKIWIKQYAKVFYVCLLTKRLKSKAKMQFAHNHLDTKLRKNLKLCFCPGWLYFCCNIFWFLYRLRTHFKRFLWSFKHHIQRKVFSWLCMDTFKFWNIRTSRNRVDWKGAVWLLQVRFCVGCCIGSCHTFVTYTHSDSTNTTNEK